VKQGLKVFEGIVSIIGLAPNSGWRDFDVSVCVRSGVKQRLKLFEWIVFVIGPARNRGWSYPWEQSLQSVLGETGFEPSRAVTFAVGPWQIEGIAIWRREAWTVRKSEKNTRKKDIRNPYSNPYTEQKFDQMGAQTNSWDVFHCKSNTFAHATCFLPSVLGETGVGGLSMSPFVLGPAWNRGWHDFDVFFCVRSGVKQGLKLFEGIVFIIGPARNRGWRGFDVSFRVRSGVKQGLKLFEGIVFIISPARNRGWRDFNVSVCVRSGVKQGLKLFEWIVFVIGPARNRGWSYPWEQSLSSVLGETGFEPSRAVTFAVGPW
jgi:hypothetical protein